MGGMPSGSGFVFGGGWVRGLESDILTISADARYSTRSFKQADLRLVFPTAQSGRPIRAFVTASYQDYPGLRFYGLGNDSQLDNRSFFGQKNLIMGGGIAGESRWIDAGAEYNRMRVETGSANRAPSVEDSFPIVADPNLAPLFGRDTEYNIIGGFLRFNLVDLYDYPQVGMELTLAGWRYDDQDLDVLNFNRIIGHLRGQIPLGNRSRRLAFQIRTSHSTADVGNAVPIYLMETLGGANSIRGYREFRFRDRRNLLVNVEYRWEVWTYADFAFFYDGGKAFRNAGDLNFRNLHSGYGWGMHVHAPGEVFVNIDLARSPEGFKLHIGSGLGF